MDGGITARNIRGVVQDSIGTPIPIPRRGWLVGRYRRRTLHLHRHAWG